MLRKGLFAAIVSLNLAVPSVGAAPSPPPKSHLALSWHWDWGEFKRFWSKQLGKTTGVVGAVSLVVAAGVLIVMSARKKT